MRHHVSRCGLALLIGVHAPGCGRATYGDLDAPADGHSTTSLGAGSELTAADLTLNVNSLATLAVVGGVPPLQFSIVADADRSGQSRIDARTGVYRSGGHPASAVVRVTDAAGQTAYASITVEGTGVIALGGADYSGASRVHPEVYHSADGVVWDKLGALPQGREDGSSIVFADRIWYAGGFDGDRVRREVWSSPDGAEWLEHAPLPAPRDAGCLVVLDGRLYHLGGTDDDSSSGSADDVWVTDDGTSWSSAGALPLPLGALGCAVLAGRIWIAGGWTSGSWWRHEVYSSADAVSWTPEAPLVEARSHLTLAIDGGDLVAIGSTSTVERRRQGQWMVAGGLPLDVEAGALVSVPAGLLWVAGAQGGGLSESNVVWESADGEVWSCVGTYPRLAGWLTGVSFTPKAVFAP